MNNLGVALEIIVGATGSTGETVGKLRGLFDGSIVVMPSFDFILLYE